MSKRKLEEIPIKDPIPIYFKSLLSTAYKVYEEETLHNLKNRHMSNHLVSMLSQSNKRGISQ